MNVSAADILTVTTYVFGAYDPKESFKSMADRIVAARPADWRRLMKTAEQQRGGDVVHDYKAAAAALRAAVEA